LRQRRAWLKINSAAGMPLKAAKGGSMAQEPIRFPKIMLTDMLSYELTTYELKWLAMLIASKVPIRKAELVELITSYLAGGGLRAVWDRLDDLQRKAVAEAVHNPEGTLYSTKFIAKYGAYPAMGSLNGWSNDTPTLLRLIFPNGHTIPSDIRKRLAEFVPPPPKTTLKTVAPLPARYAMQVKTWNKTKKEYQTVTVEIPLTVHESERRGQRELFAVLRLAEAGKLTISEVTRRPSAAAVHKVTEVLDGGDFYIEDPPEKKQTDSEIGPIRAFAWPMLLQAGGLAKLAGGKMQLTPAGRKALSAPVQQTVRGLWKKWTGTTLIDELSRIDIVKGQTGKGKKFLTAPSSRRQTAAEALAACPAGQWVAFWDLQAYMIASGQDFLVSRDPMSLYVSASNYGYFTDGGGILSQRYLMCLLLEYAATLGMFDVALIHPAEAPRDFADHWGTDDASFFSRYDGLAYIRLTPLGAYCLGVADAWAPAPSVIAALDAPTIRLLPDLSIEPAGADLPPGDALALDHYGIRSKTGAWQLDVAKLMSAVEQGQTPDEIRAFLASRSGGPLPDHFERLLGQIALRSIQVRDLGLVRLVECAYAELASEIAAHPATGKHCAQAGERWLVVFPAAEDAFRSALRDVGYALAGPGIIAALDPGVARPDGSMSKRRRKRSP